MTSLIALGAILCLLSCNSLKTTSATSSSSSPTQLTLVIPNQPETGVCQAYQLQSTDGQGNPLPVSTSKTNTLSAGSSLTVQFYPDSTCSSLPITSMSIPAGLSSVTFYLRDNLPENFTLTATVSDASLLAATTQVKVQTLQDFVDLFMGGMSGVGSFDGSGAFARFFNPTAVAMSNGNLFILDSLNHTLRKVVITTGAVTTFVGTPGTIGSNDAAGPTASFNSPQGLVVDPTGTNIFVSDTNNHTIRKIVISSGLVSTLAGTAGSPGSNDLTGSAARFDKPVGISIDATGTNLYVADTGNCTIRKIVVGSGLTSTVAGTAGTCGSLDATGPNATFNAPQGIALDTTNLYVADSGNHTIRQIVISSGAVTTLAGTATEPGSADGSGSIAAFDNPKGIFVFGGFAYVADSNNGTIRKVNTTSGAVTTRAGQAGHWGSADGPSATASFYYPSGLTTDGSSLFVADTANQTVRQLTFSSDTVSTLAGASKSGPQDGSQSSALLGAVGVTGLATSDGQTIYFTDNCALRKLFLLGGIISTIAGDYAACGSATNGNGTNARFGQPQGLVVSATDIYIADQGACSIRDYNKATGAVSTFAGTNGTCIPADGTVAAAFAAPRGLATDGTHLFVTDVQSCTIREILISSKDVTTLAGSAGTCAFLDASGSSARFNAPSGIVTDGTNLYIADTGNHAIRQIVIASGAVSTIAGTAGTAGSTDGTGTNAKFNGPLALTLDGAGALFVADTNNQTIRKIVLASGVVTTVAGAAAAVVTQTLNGTALNATFAFPGSLLFTPSGLFISDGSSSQTPPLMGALRWLH